MEQETYVTLTVDEYAEIQNTLLRHEQEIQSLKERVSQVEKISETNSLLALF